MVFTTQFFTFVFLPLVILSFLIVERMSYAKKFGTLVQKFRLSDIILIIFSLGFYAWALFDNVFRLLVYIIGVYCISLLLDNFKNSRKYIYIGQEGTNEKRKFYISTIPFTLGIAVLTFILVYFNYSNFIINCWNIFFRTDITAKSLIAPLGLSFITFSAISYVTDVYRGLAKQGSLIDCMLYISFFPKVISGPIVLYRDFKSQTNNRKCDIDKFSTGINLIIIGFAKKVILADSFGMCLAKFSPYNIDSITALGSVLLYMLQIYYDFSGYSDIAIGISKLFGYDFQANFNFPYRSKSISEFWRRWHISLGTWFREYIYFPLGGSRINPKRTLINLGIVFALTGIWHGAGWNYILWGAINAACVLIERIVADRKYYKKTPTAVKYIATMLIVMGFWQFFKYQDVMDVARIFSIGFGLRTFIRPFDVIPYTWQYYYDTQIIVFTVIGILGATVFGSPKAINLYKQFISTKIGYIIQEIILFILFIIAVLFMVSSTYRPFIYFQY